MAISLTDLQTPVTADSIRDAVLEVLTELSFPVEAWQEEGIARTLIEAFSAMLATQSETIAALAKMPYLDSASDDYLTNLAASHYDVSRGDAVAATLPVSLANGGLVTYSPGVGEIVLRASNGQTYSSSEASVVTAGATTIVQFTADTAGALANVPGQQLEFATPLAGVVATFDGIFAGVGADAESDAALRARCPIKWAALRIERADDGIRSLAREAAPAVLSVGVDSDAPRGPGTVDVYLAGENATAGISDVAAVQAALDLAFLGNSVGGTAPLVKAIAAPTQAIDLVATIYVRGVDSSGAQTGLEAAWAALLESVPVGGFDLSPGPTHTIQLGQIIAALGEVAGVISVEMAAPAADVAVGATSKVILGSTSISIVRLSS